MCQGFRVLAFGGLGFAVPGSEVKGFIFWV